MVCWQLEQIPGLVERMATLMCVGEDAEEEGEEESEEDAVGEIEKTDFEALIIAAKTAAQERGERLQWLELDDLGMTDEDLQSLDLASKCPVRI
jgi:tubulin--tyrosine ligase-like protein 12